MNNYKHDTSKFSKGVIGPECAPTLKMLLLKLKPTTSAEKFNISKQNQFKRQRKLLSNLLPKCDRVIKSLLYSIQTALLLHNADDHRKYFIDPNSFSKNFCRKSCQEVF